MFTFIVFCLFIVTEVCLMLYLLNKIFAIINFLPKFAL